MSRRSRTMRLDVVRAGGPISIWKTDRLGMGHKLPRLKSGDRWDTTKRGEARRGPPWRAMHPLPLVDWAATLVEDEATPNSSDLRDDPPPLSR
jgi:hypothetical protein